MGRITHVRGIQIVREVGAMCGDRRKVVRPVVCLVSRNHRVRQFHGGGGSVVDVGREDGRLRPSHFRGGYVGEPIGDWI